jgi:hypothetical protein
MRHTLAVVAALTLAVVAPVLAQDPAPLAEPSPARPLPIEAKKLVPHRDSMNVLINNQQMGTSVWGLQQLGDGFVAHESTTIGTTMSQTTTVELTKSGEAQRVTQSGMVRDVPGAINISYAGGRVTGTVDAVTPTGPKHFAVDTTVPPGTVDDNALQALLPALPWAKNAGWNFWMYSAGTNAVTEMVLYVIAEEMAMVPAGAFEAYRARLSGGATDVEFLILKRAPHTVLKIELSGAPLKYELVSGGGL